MKLIFKDQASARPGISKLLPSCLAEEFRVRKKGQDHPLRKGRKDPGKAGFVKCVRADGSGAYLV